MSIRIAVVQHGNLPSARRSRLQDEPEPYFGMHYSQGFLDRWMASRPHLVISLNGDPEVIEEGNGRLVTIPAPTIHPKAPFTVGTIIWYAKICRELIRFRPTHFLLRTNDLLAVGLLRLAARKRWETLAMFAGFFRKERRYDRFVSRELVRQLNRSNVLWVGNHREPATRSMVDAGLNPRKAIAWDYVVTRTPSQFPIKNLGIGTIRLFMAGNLIAAKGVGDLIEAAKILIDQRTDIKLVLGGTSESMHEWRLQAESLGDRVEFLGLISNERVVEEMTKATFVVVPTRPEFPEGFPMTFTESLTVRTPVIASTHPVFTSALRDGDGVKFFKAGEPRALAALVMELKQNTEEYRTLSHRTEEAFAKLQCPTRFHEIIEHWLPAA